MKKQSNKESGSKAFVPEWARDAVWYQVFPDRFRNGTRKNDPVLGDIAEVPLKGWTVSPWGKDWYALDRWEEIFGNFQRSVYYRRFGGDLVGLRKKLGYLQKLGINAIYLNPIFMAPSLHKYDAVCLHHVDPTFGPDRAGDLELLAQAHETEEPRTWIWTAADRYFIDLVAEIHRRGMRVIIDGVFNHVGARFFAFEDVLKNGKNSRYKKWFRINQWNPDGSFEYRCWFGHRALPELARTEQDLVKPVRDYLFAVTRRWMDPNDDGDPSDGVDGWRLDVAFCVPHGFWKKWRKQVKHINPEAFITAELVELAEDYLQGDEFDSVMNYMWLFPTVRFFSPSAKPISVRALKRSLNALLKAYPEEVTGVLQNLLDSHDVARILTVLENGLNVRADWDSYFRLGSVASNPKLITRKPGRKARQILRQMIIFQMTYPGAPMLYYGTEVGMWGANDPDNRQPMIWDDLSYEPEAHQLAGSCAPAQREPDRELFLFCQKAIALRRKKETLRRGGFQWYDTQDDRVLGFIRTHDGEEILVLLNASDEKKTFRLPSEMKDLWGGGKRVRKDKVNLDARGWRILSRSV